MPFRIKLARTTAELDGLFQLRHQVFVEEKRYLPPSCNGRLSDAFDSYPTTGNLVALVDGRVVGGLRFVEPSPAGAPADTFFDFRPHLPPDAARVGSGSMLLVDPLYREMPGLASALLGMGHYWAISRGLTHITGISAPAAEKLFIGCGYKAVVERFFHQPTQLYAMPVLLDIRELNARLRSFVDEQSTHGFAETFDRQFHSPGDLLLSTEQEDRGIVYRILNGSVALTARECAQAYAVAHHAPAREPLMVLKAGASFSHRTLRKLRMRDAAMVALTDLSLMVLAQARPFRPETRISGQRFRLPAVAPGRAMARPEGLMSSAA